jgi:hypothetical protein
MSRSYRALVRVFGATGAVNDLRIKCLLSEAETPSQEFTLKPLRIFEGPTNMQGFALYGESSNREPSFSSLDFAKLTRTYPSVIVEKLVDDSDIENLTVLQAGNVVYEAWREGNGDVYELGEPGVRFFYGKEVGERDQFVRALATAGVTRHGVKSI